MSFFVFKILIVIGISLAGYSLYKYIKVDNTDNSGSSDSWVEF